MIDNIFHLVEPGRLEPSGRLHVGQPGHSHAEASLLSIFFCSMEVDRLAIKTFRCHEVRRAINSC